MVQVTWLISIPNSICNLYAVSPDDVLISAFFNKIFLNQCETRLPIPVLEKNCSSTTTLKKQRVDVRLPDEKNASKANFSVLLSMRL